jgi:hypothetical protein
MGFIDIFRKKDVSEPIKAPFSEKSDSIKDELGDHLDAINKNSNEIQTNYELISELNSKVEKLNEKIERLQMLLEDKESEEEPVAITTLTFREQEVFLVMYTCGEQPLTYKDIAHKTGLTELLVQGYIINIIKKGIPIVKKYVNNKVYLSLDKEFRDLHTRKNIVKIDSPVGRNVGL